MDSLHLSSTRARRPEHAAKTRNLAQPRLEMRARNHPRTLLPCPVQEADPVEIHTAGCRRDLSLSTRPLRSVGRENAWAEPWSCTGRGTCRGCLHHEAETGEIESLEPIGRLEGTGPESAARVRPVRHPSQTHACFGSTYYRTNKTSLCQRVELSRAETSKTRRHIRPAEPHLGPGRAADSP